MNTPLVKADVIPVATGFKKVNGTYGHAAGDLVLQHFADLLRRNLRGSDILARFGGEEFIFLFPHTSAREGGCILEKLRGLCETSDVATPEGAIRVTASFGVTALPPDATAPPDVLLAQLVQRADAALYHSKGRGRNRVTIDTDAPA